MTLMKVIVVALAVTTVSCRPKESTHDLLSRLGFDPVFKPGVNNHKKRVAEESDAARFGGSYNSDSDSSMFVVRLPPHHPYYSNLVPEKLENEVSKSSVNFPVNGKPSQVYHWNMPLLKKLAKHKKTKYPKDKHDSKIVRLNIKSSDDEFSFYKKLKKDDKPNVYKLKKEHVMSIKELAEHQNDRPIVEESAFNEVSERDSKFTHIVPNKHKYMSRKTPAKSDSKMTVIKYNSFHPNQLQKQDGGGVKKKTFEQPLVYSPSIPKNSSLFKYFPGNGRPKSFYVIDKNASPSRLHRLL